MVQRAFRLLELKRLAEQINVARTPEDILTCLEKVESLCPSTGNLSVLSIIPPTTSRRTDWKKMLSSIPVPGKAIDRMLDSGFVPLELGILDRVTSGIGSLAIGSAERVCLLDPDYGAVLFGDNNRLANSTFCHSDMQRYDQELPQIYQYPAMYYSLGALRGRKLHVGKLEGEYDKVLEFDINDKSDIIDALNRIEEAREVQGAPYEIWFRGQNSDYLLEDLKAEASSGLCPWRMVQDSSLVPSLYRQLYASIDDLREYLAISFEFLLASAFIELYLDIPPFSTRPVTEDPSKRLSQQFDRIAPRWSVILNEQVSHDYHHAFRNIQNVFFLQHYGLPSTVLDITKSLDVALFFAQNRVSGNRYVPVDQDSNPVVYVFLLVPQLDMFVDSGQLCEHYQLLRPLRQQCGLLAGASVLTRNDYGKFVALKLRIRRRITELEVTEEYLMPSPSDDSFLAKLLEFSDNQGFSRIKPFVQDAA